MAARAYWSPPSGCGGAADAGWLALRSEADTRARDLRADALEALVGHLRGRGVMSLEVVDAGAGTGANRRYLSARLPFDQEWVAVDHDADLLQHPDHGAVRTVRADVADLPGVLADLRDGASGARPAGAAVLLTCTALLDVLPERQLRGLADAVVDAGGLALLALSVTGEVGWDPAEPEDGLVAAAFDAHQQRGGRPGPDAPAVLTDLLAERDLLVTQARTPWLLDARDHGDAALLGRWLDERLAAVREHDPDLAGALAGWHGQRREQLSRADLRVQVDHVDLFVTPRSSGSDGEPVVS